MKKYFVDFMQDNRGDGYMDVVMKILIAVVLGGLLLTIMRAAMPSVFQNLISKIQELISGIDADSTSTGGTFDPSQGVS